jgi:peptidoglycan/xylan/chitin deacetylase (PgdA/CDA1 family)
MLSFDFDAESLWFGTYDRHTPSPISRGHFGASTGMPRLLSLLDENAVPATFFIPAWVAETYPDLCGRICERGDEVGYHGYYHESVHGLEKNEERELMLRAMATVEERTGQRPVGNRTPPFDLGVNTVDLLVELGFTYDSSLMGSDEPYILDERGLLEIPVCWELDDAPYWIYSTAPPRSGLWSIEHVENVWRAEFDAAYAAGGTMTLVMHPQVIGRRPRIAMLQRLITYMQSHSNVSFVRHRDLASDWHAACASSVPRGDENGVAIDGGAQ